MMGSALALSAAFIAAAWCCAMLQWGSLQHRSLRPTPAAMKHELYFGLSTQDFHCENIRRGFADSISAAESRNGMLHGPVVAVTPCSSRPVHDTEFDSFLEQEVVPRFSSGFSVFSGTGYYGLTLAQTGELAGAGAVVTTVKEGCRVLVVVEPDIDARRSGSLLTRLMDDAYFFSPTMRAADEDAATPTQQALVDVAGLYRHFFKQESVMWVRSAATVEFVSSAAPTAR